MLLKKYWLEVEVTTNDIGVIEQVRVKTTTINPYKETVEVVPCEMTRTTPIVTLEDSSFSSLELVNTVDLGDDT